MIKKNVTYTNYNGEETTESFYFHLSQAELLRLEMATKGGLEAALNSMVEAKDGAGIMSYLETFITKSVGIKSEDGSRFNKSPEILADFVSSPAYDTLFMELCTDPEKAAEFLNGIVPPELAKNVERLSKLDQVKANVAERQQAPIKNADPREGGNVFEQDTKNDHLVKVREITQAELIAMSAEDFAVAQREIGAGIAVLVNE